MPIFFSFLRWWEFRKEIFAERTHKALFSWVGLFDELDFRLREDEGEV